MTDEMIKSEIVYRLVNKKFNKTFMTTSTESVISYLWGKKFSDVILIKSDDTSDRIFELQDKTGNLFILQLELKQF